jgi:hypothetical protein
MDPQDLQPKGGNAPSQTNDPATNESVGERIFDISEDNISPISSEALVGAEQPMANVNLAKADSSSTEVDTAGLEKRSTPPLEGELLDQKIGTFDPSPFAPPVQRAAPVIGLYPTRPTQPPQPIATPVPTTPTPLFKKTAPTSLGSIQPKPINPPAAPPTPPRLKSLQEEAYAALPANLRPKPAVPPQPVVPTLPTTPTAPTLSRPLPTDTMPREIVKPVRTYEGDVAEAMSHKRTSRASIAIAESKKREQGETISNEKEEPSHAGKKISMLAISLLLLCGGAYGAYYLYSKSALAPVTPVVQQQQAAPSIIPSTSQVVVTINTDSPALIRQRLSNEVRRPQAPNTIQEVVVATQNTSGTLSRVPAQEMLQLLDINTPDVLSRSLTAAWMLGVYNDNTNTKSVFIVGTTNFFQNAFAGMLQWERVMADDLRPYFYSETVEGVANDPRPQTVTPAEGSLSTIDSILPSVGTTTATSTKPTTLATTTQPTASTTPEVVQPLKQYLTIRGKFEDRIIKNKDVRAFRTDEGTILFLYSFIDNTHLVVTDKESTLAEILTRLEKQSFIR